MVRNTTILPDLALILAAAALAAGCGSSAIPRAQAPQAPDTGQAKCSVSASSSNPLVTEWPASEKANLELRLHDGAVAVAYTGCELRLVPECNLGGEYRWQRTTVSSDAFEVRDADELYAKLPIGAASLEGELNQSGRLAVKTTVAGQMRLFGTAPAQAPRACWSATHVLSAMSVGAFTLRSGGSQGARAGADTPIGDVGAGTKSEESLMREAGNPERCADATDAGAHAECGSPIQLFLTPIHAAPHAFAAPQPAAPPPAAPVQPAPAPDPKPPTPSAEPTKPAPPPPSAEPTKPAPPKPPEPAPAPAPAPTAEPWLPPAPAGPLGPAPAATSDSKPEDEEPSVALHVTSTDPDVTFVVNAGGKSLCTTPCKTRVLASDLVELKQIGDDAAKPQTVKNLRDLAAAGSLDVEVEPRSGAAFFGGIALVAIGASSLMAGMMMLLLGGRSDNTGVQVGGGVALAAAVGTALPGALLFIGSFSDIEVKPTPGVKLSFGPGYLGGTF